MMDCFFLFTPKPVLRSQKNGILFRESHHDLFFVNARMDVSPPGGTGFLHSQKKLKCFFIYIMINSVQPTTTTTTTTTMFSFLRNGDINNNLKGLTNLPGLFASDGDKIKYAILNHSTAMRRNLRDGAPIFTNIRQFEAELERRDIKSMMDGVLPSMIANAAAATASLFTDNDLRIDNAALTFIMAKELAFLNRTIQMIALIANRYNEEQEDLECSPRWGDDNDDDDDHSNQSDDEDLEQGYYEDDNCYSPAAAPLERSHSHPTNEHGGGDKRITGTNQLAATFLIASGRLLQRFNNLCVLAGTNPVLVNAMTTMDSPRNHANHAKQLSAESLVIRDIFIHLCKFDAHHRDQVVAAFMELRDISVSAWKILSMYAFSNLFRLTAGTEFAMQPYQPEDAIFTQGRDYSLTRQDHEKKGATLMCVQVIAEAADAEAVAQKQEEGQQVQSYD